MATQAQIAANRNNAQKSTGPKTPEGKAAVRLNGLKHGLASDILVLPGESVADFENLLDSLEAEHQPATPTEVILVRQMAMASWRLNRLVHMEASYYRLRRTGLQVHFKNYYDDNLSEPDRQAIIVEDDINHTLLNFSRYEARLEHSFHKALTALQRLRAQRKSDMTNQSQFQAGAAETARSNPSNAGVQSPPDADVGHARPGFKHAEPINRPPPIQNGRPAAPAEQRM